MHTVLVPLVKNRAGDLSSADNYRPIALCTVASKVMESILSHRLNDYLYVEDNQFGFRKGLSTDMCIYTFKQIIEYYTTHSSPSYICYIDSKKAFDRVNHWTMFSKLLKRGVPLYIVRILVHWYNTQQYSVLWCGITSDLFTASNGVKQGGILSPKLFAVYMDDLSIALNRLNVGSKLGGIRVNHLSFADDIALIAPSAKGLQAILSVCEKYALDHDIVYNTSKTVCMLIRPKKLSNLKRVSLSLCGNELEFVEQYKYLGVLISNVSSDNNDIDRQRRALYRRANMLFRKFHACSVEVKQMLFQTYCMNMYCAQLWCNFTKKTMQKLRVAYNNCLRRFLGFPRFCSASGMFVSNNIRSFDEVIRKYIVSFRNRIEISANKLIKGINSTNLLLVSSLTKSWYNQLYVNPVSYIS